MASTRMHRRSPRPSPMRSLRVGDAARIGAVPRLAFPGFAAPPAGGRSRRLVSGAAAAALHAAAFAALLAAAILAPPEEPEKPIPVQLLPPPAPPAPKPPPPEPQVVESAPEPAPAPAPKPAPAPAPAPKALAERRSPRFAPSAQAVRPQVVNPTVVARAAPVVPAERLDMDSVSTVTAPREISRRPVVVESVQAPTSVASAVQGRVDLGDAGAPALRGPIEREAPAGQSVGPRQVIASGSSVGTGAVDVGDGSSVREGVPSDRDVLGTPDGPRLANVNTRVGQSNLRGPGGEGTEIGGGSPDCLSRPEVKSYLSRVRERTIARWNAGDAPLGSYEVTLRFQLDVGGSASRVQLVSSDDARVGSTAVDALRAASPFDPMADPVRCLANSHILATFRLESTSSAIAN